MEACGSAHHWARKLTQYGHTVKLMAPQYVKPYVKTNKNDANDAEAICEAVARPNMRFVPIKDVDQQAILSLHRARQGFVKSRTAQANQLRGLLAEYGVTIPQGINQIAKRIPIILENQDNDLPITMLSLVSRLYEHFKALGAEVDAIDETIMNWHKQSEASMRLCRIGGVGVLTATAIVATVGNAENFSSGSQFAAWLGIVPRQQSSGGKQTLLGMSKRGDVYIRTLLIHGARAALRYVARPGEVKLQEDVPGQAPSQNASGQVSKSKSKLAPATRRWLESMLIRRNHNVVAVALANKNARVIWAMLRHQSQFHPDYAAAKSAAT
jgi:transposase